MDSGKPISATAVINADIQYDALQVHLGFERLWMRGVGLLSALIVGPIGAWLMWHDNAVLGVILIALSICVGGWAAFENVRFRRHIRSNWRQLDCGEDVQVHFEISPSGLQMEDKDAILRVEWNKFRSWREGRGLLLAYRTDEHYWPIPVSQFEPATAGIIRERLKASCRER